MDVYLNFTPRQGPYGGANSFLRSLMTALESRGVRFTTDERASVDVALVNALTNEMTLDRVRALAERGIPVVHRKTGYRGRGTPELRAEVDGAIVGDRLQVEFTPYLRHTVFQSEYSRAVFRAAGFAGAATVIPNGVDERIFNMMPPLRFGRPRPRPTWSEGSVLRVVISTWSTDESKGFAHYRAIDETLRGRRDVACTLVGRVPARTRFRAIRVLRPRPAAKLAAVLKQHHVLLQLTEHESCSNALIEGLNCGLAAIFLDSGANREMAEPYGVDWRGSLDEALGRLRPKLTWIVSELPRNPYRISLVAPRYHELLAAVAAGTPVPA
jgi:hypothetical protein